MPGGFGEAGVFSPSDFWSLSPVASLFPSSMLLPSLKFLPSPAVPARRDFSGDTVASGTVVDVLSICFRMYEKADKKQIWQCGHGNANYKEGLGIQERRNVDAYEG